MAVYLNNGFIGKSATVNGSIYSANGDVEFNSAGDNYVTGNIYLNSSNQFTIPSGGKAGIKDKVQYLTDTHFNESVPELASFPTISNYIASYVPVWNTAPLTVSENTQFGTLKIGKDITVDTSKGDIIMVVDNLSSDWGSSINVEGDGALYLFIKSCNATNPINIENGNDPDKTYIISTASLSNYNMDLYAHVFYEDIDSLSLLGSITGSVVTDASDLTLKGWGNDVTGLLYAPETDVTVEGSGKIIGRLVADSLTLQGTGNITYASAYTSLSIPAQFLMHEVNVNTNISGAGTVSPTYKKVNYGEVVTITATANDGYTFTGFTSSDSTMVPDSNGKIAVIGDVNIVANFKANVITGDYVNGILGEYFDASEFDNDSALRMTRIDSNIAHNYMYDSPDDVIEPETFAIRWTGYIMPTVSGNYTFKTYSDDGIVVNVNNTKVIDNWGALSLDFTVADSAVYLEAGNYYPISVEYQQLPLYAASFLFWQSESVPMSLVPDSAYYVSATDYTSYCNEQYANELDRSGNGFNNEFYALDDEGDRINETSENNNIVYFWDTSAPEGITEDVFYGEMEGYLEAKFTEPITLQFIVDDGIKVWIDDKLVIDEWGWHDVEVLESSEFNVIVGQKYKVRIEYIDKGFGATCVMRWKGNTLGLEDIPKEYMYVQ